ncbi:MAG: GNAT family N-acetyltransferase [Anaerolineaceae bacterium]|nr:GNAT family N-acetyltransferase [Anaerolineaceae bacterium]
MSIQFRILVPEDAAGFIDFFDNMDFQHAEHWRGCYCQYDHLLDSDEPWEKVRGAKARQMALGNVKCGYTRGILAMDGAKIIGWCHVNSYENLPRIHAYFAPNLKEGRNAIIVCFMVHPHYRRQGLALALLEAALENCKKEGFAALHGLAATNVSVPERAYHGTMQMYEKAGFTLIDTKDSLAFYRLEFALKES